MTPLLPGDVSACVFDAYGTLFDLNLLAETCRDRLGDKAAAFADLWRRKQLEYSWLRSLMGRHSDFWHVTGDGLDYAMAAFGLADPVLRSRLMEAYMQPRAFPEVPAMLARLRAGGLKTAILSNGTPAMLTSGVAVAGLERQFDAVLSVERAGIYKPHPSAYKLASDHFGLPARNILFLSGNGWDVAGASAFGFRVLWVNRAGAAPDHLPARPDGEIKNLSKLPQHLGL